MNLSNIIHIGVFTKDINKAAEYLDSQCGIGPWEIYPELHENAIYKENQEHKLNYIAAMAPFGSIHLELIQPTGGMSVFEDDFKKNGEGVHHVCIQVENIEKAKAEAKDEGYEILDEVPMYEMEPGFSLGFFFMRSKEANLVYEVVEERHEDK